MTPVTDPVEVTEVTFEEYLGHARNDMAPKMASSAFVVSINPGAKPEDIDPKIAIETGYAVLLGKPILVVNTEGRELNPGLARLARKVVSLTEPIDTMASQMQMQAAIEEMLREVKG